MATKPVEVESPGEPGEGTRLVNNIFTMKSLILAQDER